MMVNKRYALILLLFLGGCEPHLPHRAGERQVVNGESGPDISAVFYEDKGDGFIESLLSEEDVEIGISVPASYSSDRNYFYGDDFNRFMAILKEELLKSEIIGSVRDNYDESALVLVVNFIVTSHDSHDKKFEAFVELKMAFRGNKWTDVYDVSSSYADREVSSEDDFVREKNRLMDRVISLMLDDISRFLKINHEEL